MKQWAAGYAAPATDAPAREAAEIERRERAAIRDEPALPPPGTPERAKLETRHAAALGGYLRAVLMRPPSWADPAILPTPGCFCSCCNGQRWWTRSDRPEGWRCWPCHPPSGQESTKVREVRT